MTLAHAERLKASHRGVSRAEPASRSRIMALDSFGLRYERIDDFNVMVEGEYQLNLAMSYWRHVDDDSRKGYLVSTLDAEIKRHRKPETPVTGRESVAVSDRIADSTTATQPAIAESMTGTVSAERSSSLLPLVTL